ncbi:MAG: SMC-Scp complex subunit ScpB, partial [Eubacteriales bacterium]|nr:SMC-Scp complex subunit ScpB [Eubacteriales bacterium]
EAILFVSGDSVPVPEVARALGLTELETMHAVEELQHRYESENHGITLKRYGDHLKLETRAEYAPYVERLLQPVQKQSLSQAAMETLAVVAYRQPVTKAEVEMVRGVKCDYSMQSLLAKGLVKEVGRKDALGRPILYATTDDFLEHFGISDVRELPPLPAPTPVEPGEPLVP